MFWKTKKDKRSSIDKEIDSVIEVMSMLNADTEEYTKMAANLAVLMQGRSYNKDNIKISKDVIINGVFSILGILIIVGYEQCHVMGSKALVFVTKGRV